MKKFLQHYSLLICNLLFFCFCIDLFLVSYFNIFTNHTYYLRILLIPSLFIYVTAVSRTKDHFLLKLIVICSLFLAWIADLFLLQNNSYAFGANFFFLTLSVVFLFLFMYKLAPFNRKEKALANMIFTGIGIAIAYLFFYKLIDTEFNAESFFFKIAVMAYFIVLAVVGISTANLCADKKRKQLAYAYFLPGNLLFLISALFNLGLKLKNIDFSFMQMLVVFTLFYGHYYTAKGYAKYLSGTQ